MGERPTLGFIGVGAMGGPMAGHLLTAGYRVVVYDRQDERRDALVARGAEPGADEADTLKRCDVLCLSLPSSQACITVADSILLPNLRGGQVVIDFGTTMALETERLAREASERGAGWIDCPVSGGEGGARQAKLRMFAGGDPETFATVRPILETVGGSDSLTYCGPVGSGQIVKGVNQLAMGLGAAAYLEAVAYGVRAGIAPETLARAVGGSGGWRGTVRDTAQAVSEERAEQIGVKFRELLYFILDAEERGYALPLTEMLYSLCDAGPRVVIDDNREAPSYWHELLRLGAVNQPAATPPKNETQGNKNG